MSLIYDMLVIQNNSQRRGHEIECQEKNQTIFVHIYHKRTKIAVDSI